MNNDLRLAQRIAARDANAFESFVDIYGARVHRLVSRYTQSDADAEDLTQEIFLDLYRGIALFRGDSSLATWVYRVAMNHCLKHQGRASSAPAALDEAHEETDCDADPLRLALRGELRERVQSALGMLSPLHRDIVVLHELHGLTYSECARVLDVPIGTVKSRLSNAFRRLRHNLSGYVLGENAPLSPNALGATAGVEALGETL